MAVMTTVAPNSTAKLPASVARLMIAPRPVTENVWFRKRKYSAMMLAFQAPPDAVTNPVMRNGKNRRQDQLAPTLHASQPKDVADFLEVGGNGASRRQSR
jgi:hypothetical protein